MHRSKLAVLILFICQFLLLLQVAGEIPEPSFRSAKTVPGCDTHLDEQQAANLHAWNQSSGFSQGTRQTLVLCIQFPDFPAELSRAGVDSMMNINTFDGVNGKGSFQDYFSEVSYGKFIPESHVYGWYTAKENYDYYANVLNSSAARDSLFLEALAQANAAGIDFSPFDNDGDGKAEAVILQTSRAIGAQARFSVNQVYQNIEFTTFTIQPVDGKNFRLGTTCHEYGHIFGLPDLYLTDEPLGLYDIMSHAKSTIPGHFSAWSKIRLGWIEPVIVSEITAGVQIPGSFDNPFALKIYDEPFNDDRYFLIENRRRKGYDAAPAALRGDGILIYHIDETHDNEWVRALQADGRDDLRKWNTSAGSDGNVGDAGDFYPGSTNNRELTAKSYPNSLDFFGANWGVAVTNISASSDLMSADIQPSQVGGATLRYDDGIDGNFRSKPWTRIPFRANQLADSIWAGAIFYPQAGDSLWGVKTGFYGLYPNGISSKDIRRYHIRIYSRFNHATNTPEELIYSQDGALPLPLEGPYSYIIARMPTIWLDAPFAAPESLFTALCMIRDQNEPTVANHIVVDILGEPSGKSYLAYGADFPTFSPFSESSLNKNRDVTLRLFMLAPGDRPTGISNPEKKRSPLTYRLSQNYPNPFNPRTTISYKLSERTYVTLVVFDLRGRKVALLANGIKNAGEHIVNFEGSKLASGLYFYQIKTAGFVKTKKMLLVK